MKVIDILELIATLKSIHNQRDETNKPVLQGRVALQVAKARRDIDNQISPKDIEEQRTALLDMYAEKDENGKWIMLEQNRVKLINAEEFRQKEKELLETDFEITIPKIPEAILDMVNLTGDQALIIEPLLEAEKIIKLEA